MVDRDREMVKKVDDFIEEQIFFISFKRDEWIPNHLRGYQRGSLQFIGFRYAKKLEVKDWLEYHSLFDYNSKCGYTLSKKGKKLLEEEGYDLVHFSGDELDEAFIVNPPEQVTNIHTVSLKHLT